MVDHLVLEERRADLLGGLRVLLDELEELALLAGILARLGHDGLGHLLVGDLDLRLLAQLGQQESQPHAPLGQLAVLLGRLDLLVVVALHVGMLLVPELVGDLPGLRIDQRGRQVERYLVVEPVEQAALEHLARRAGILALEPIGDLTLQRGEVVRAEPPGQLVVHRGPRRGAFTALIVTSKTPSFPLRASAW